MSKLYIVPFVFIALAIGGSIELYKIIKKTGIRKVKHYYRELFITMVLYAIVILSTMFLHKNNL